MNASRFAQLVVLGTVLAAGSVMLAFGNAGGLWLLTPLFACVLSSGRRPELALRAEALYTLTLIPVVLLLDWDDGNTIGLLVAMVLPGFALLLLALYIASTPATGQESAESLQAETPAAAEAEDPAEAPEDPAEAPEDPTAAPAEAPEELGEAPEVPAEGDEPARD